MKKEYVTTKRKEISIKLQASEINSLRVKEIERNAVRVYDNGFIGVSGAVGESTTEELTNQAIDNLSSKIPYPYELQKDLKKHVNMTTKEYSENELMELTETLLTELKKENDDFIYSESIKSINSDISLKNTEGLDLRYQDSRLELGVIVKAKTSSNLFDTFFGWEGRNIDLPRFIKNVKQQLVAERNKVEMPKEEKLPVIFLNYGPVGGFIGRHLHGEIFGNKASFFDGKLGEKLFNERITLSMSRDPLTTYTRFFDMEGVVMPDNKVSLIENGVLKRVITDKKISNKFNLEHTGSAGGGYDDIPTIGFAPMHIEVDTVNIQNALKGQKALLVIAASGGDVNADGNYATPVQSAYLYDGEKVVGKLPEFNMENHIYKMFGEDYIGTFDDPFYSGEHEQVTLCYMNILK